MHVPAIFAGLIVAILAGSPPSMAADFPNPGDFYMISRGQSGEFTGSHKIFDREASGLYEVRYCTRPYWVRAHTIAWTQVEVENRRQVRVEFNYGKGWRPLCENPEQQVTLADIGLTEDARVILHQSEAEVGAVNRFSAISNSFQKTNTTDKTDGSYHSR